MGEAYTIRIFVADGNPEGLRIIDQLNWTGLGAVFPRVDWLKAQSNKAYQFNKPGIYLLWGFVEEDDLPTVYIGQGDCVSDRLNEHFKKKDFWQYAVVFTSTSSNFNSAHAQWLEYALVEEAAKTQKCHLDNGNRPQAPALAQSDIEDAKRFFKEVVQILPLVGLSALEKANPIIPNPIRAVPANKSVLDTIIVPAKPEGFQRVFIDENCWYQIRIAGEKLDKIQWIAAYLTAPTSAITHVAQVKQIEPYGQDGKYKVVFSGTASRIGPILLADATPGALQSPRYCNYERLRAAKKVTDIWTDIG